MLEFMLINKRFLPFIIFTIFSLSIIGVILVYSPTWGLMDDWQNLERAKSVWGGDSFIKGLWSLFEVDLLGHGMLRPVYYTWVAFVYHVFRESPLILYIQIAIFNIIAIILWGYVLYKIYSPPPKYILLSIFLFPLSFFIFTPLWNISTYISVQEKFIIFFSAFALYFTEKAYFKNRCVYLVPLVAAILLSVLSNPRGIYLVVMFMLFPFLDITFFRYRKKISSMLLAVNLLFFYSYYKLVMNSNPSYISTYQKNLNLIGMLNRILTASVVIKGLLILGFVTFIYMFTVLLIKKNKYSPLVILFPIGLLSFILILSPWGFLNYHLSPMTPYLFGIVFPVYIWFNRKTKFLRILVNLSLILLVSISIFFVLVPRMSKMADVRNLESFIKQMAVEYSEAVYFMPPPYWEAAEAIECFTGAEVTYFRKDISTENVLFPENIIKSGYNNFLIYGDECREINFVGVKICDEVYQSNSWKIFKLVKEKDYNGTFSADFPKNIILKTIIHLRKLR